MKISGWGKHPFIDANILNPRCADDVMALLSQSEKEDIICRGLGRSYGDSALASEVALLRYLDHYTEFDESTGILTCEAGVSLSDILATFIPKGWFLPVTPGTKFVSVGGAIACDVHGKNHHKEGSFSDHVLAFKIATVSEGIVECSRESRPELFYATCGGMGLTGIVLEATFQLKPITSAYIDEVILKANNLDEVFAMFEEYDSYTYSVAWIDCLTTGSALGRSLLMLGEHASTGERTIGKKGKLSVPFDMPSMLLNRYSIQAFNTLYYNKTTHKRSERKTHYEPFFYPLDGINNWNRMYGKNGFTQYQFVLPKPTGKEGMREILNRIAESKKGSFLAVLKAFGKGNDNYLSFPFEGYTLALDFKLDTEVLRLLGELDNIVIEHGGRLYLCKDSRMSQRMLQLGYPDLDKFVTVRSEYGANTILNSSQSRRLGL
jgi:FAD/FMN-containing dehydrogenase